jgi:hypothetical protein
MTCEVGGYPDFPLRTFKRIKLVHFEMYGEHVEVQKEDDLPPSEHKGYIY